MIRSWQLTKFSGRIPAIPEFSTLSPLISKIIYAIPTDSYIYDVFTDDFCISRSYSWIYYSILCVSWIFRSDSQTFLFPSEWSPQICEVMLLPPKFVLLKQRYNCNLPVTNDSYNFTSDLSSRFHNPLGEKSYIRDGRPKSAAAKVGRLTFNEWLAAEEKSGEMSVCSARGTTSIQIRLPQ